MRIIWQTVRIITNEILGVKGLRKVKLVIKLNNSPDQSLFQFSWIAAQRFVRLPQTVQQYPFSTIETGTVRVEL